MIVELEYWWSWASGDGDGYTVKDEVPDEIIELIKAEGIDKISDSQNKEVRKWYRATRKGFRENNVGARPNNDGIRIHL